MAKQLRPQSADRRARSGCTYVPADLTHHTSQTKSIVANNKIWLKDPLEVKTKQ